MANDSAALSSFSQAASETAGASRPFAPKLKEANPFVGVVLLVPAYNPDEAMIHLIDRLIDQGCESIVVVDDGSASNCRSIFEQLENYDAVHVCAHASNLGKGAALKTGLRYIRQHLDTPRGVITADADGQHLPGDIRKLAETAARRPEEVALGCRDFGEKTPFRSLFGNRITSYLMAFTHGIKLADTQTGLRFLPFDLIPQLVTLSGKRYEFELQCLIAAKDAGYRINQVPISSVYIDENASSHFMPIVDSIRIYRILLHFGGSSAFCFGIDIALFALIFWAGGSAMLATIGARIVSGSVNFWINKALVFGRRDSDNSLGEALQYLALWLTLMLISGTVVTAASQRATIIVVLIKILVDVSLFLASYYAQSRFVFAKARGRDTGPGSG